LTILSISTENATPPRKPLTGVRGWLIPLLLALWIDAAARLSAGIPVLVALLRAARTHTEPTMTGLLPAASSVFMGAFGALAGYLLARKNYRGPFFAKAILLLDTGYYLMSLLAVLRGTGPTVADSVPAWTKPAAYLVSALICLVYLFRSRRVANTYFGQGSGAPQALEPPDLERVQRRPVEEVAAQAHHPLDPAPLEQEPADAFAESVPHLSTMPVDPRIARIRPWDDFNPSAPEPSRRPAAQPANAISHASADSLPVLSDGDPTPGIAWSAFIADRKPAPRPQVRPESVHPSYRRSTPDRLPEPTNGNGSHSLSRDELASDPQPAYQPEPELEPESESEPQTAQPFFGASAAHQAPEGSNGNGSHTLTWEEFIADQQPQPLAEPEAEPGHTSVEASVDDQFPEPRDWNHEPVHTPEQFVPYAEPLPENHTEVAAEEPEHFTPDLQPEPEAAIHFEPKLRSGPNSYIESEPEPWVQTEPEPAPESELIAAPVPEPQPEPEPELVDEPQPEPELIAAPVPEPEPEPEPVAEVSAIDELVALKAHIADGVVQWLSSSSMDAHAAWLRASGASRDPEKFNKKLLDQVNAICDHAWSVHTGQSPTLPNTLDSGGSLTQELQKWAIAQAASRLTRSLDIRAALEVNGPFENLIQDREYLLAIVDKHSSNEVFDKQIGLTAIETLPEPEIAWTLVLQAQRDSLEADLWARVATLAGDTDFPARFEDAGAKSFQDSIQDWRTHLRRI
jgi:hypothetical protein